MAVIHGEAPPSLTKHARVEVFSAKLLGISPRMYREYYGAILLHCCNYYCAIFQSNLLDPPLINSEGCITLNGPEKSIPVKDKIVICPWFINAKFSHMNKEEAILWRKSEEFNTFICRTIQVLNYYHLDINFAVYDDAVEAQLDVRLVDMDQGDAAFRIHGSVSCSNNVVPQSVASSVLFHRLRGDDVCIKPNGKPNESIALPLSRRIVVVPCSSPLHVHVCLAIGSESEDVSVAEGEVVFSDRSDTEDDSIIIANRGKVSVKITWT